MDDRTADDLTRLISRIKQEAHDEGRREGQATLEIVLAALHSLLADAEARIGQARPKRATRKPRSTPLADLIPQVTAAVAELAQRRPEGSDPRMITEHLQAAGHGLDISQTRQALRQLTLSGRILRAARGRYLPAAEPALAAE